MRWALSAPGGVGHRHGCCRGNRSAGRPRNRCSRIRKERRNRKHTLRPLALCAELHEVRAREGAGGAARRRHARGVRGAVSRARTGGGTREKKRLGGKGRGSRNVCQQTARRQRGTAVRGHPCPTHAPHLTTDWPPWMGTKVACRLSKSPVDLQVVCQWLNNSHPAARARRRLSGRRRVRR